LASTVFGPVLESSRLSLPLSVLQTSLAVRRTIPRSVLGEVALASWQLFPTWDDEMDGLVYSLLWPMAHSYLPWGWAYL
jgi:hypothetical protein